MLTDVEQSTIFTKTLIVRGASKSTRTRAGLSCLELIPSRDKISGELEQDLRRLLRRYRCTCQLTLTFRFLPIQYRRSYMTMVIFVLSMTWLLFLHVTVVLPNTNGNWYSYTITATHVVLELTALVSFLLSTLRDPGYLRP